jgi:hypothetical protein
LFFVIVIIKVAGLVLAIDLSWGSAAAATICIRSRLAFPKEAVVRVIPTASRSTGRRA